MAIPKITGNPFSNISTWLWERDKTFAPNPLKPEETDTVKETKINVTNLQTTLDQIVNKVNEIIDELAHTHTEYAETEHEHAAYATSGHAHTSAFPPGGTGTTGGRKGGKLQQGGYTNNYYNQPYGGGSETGNQSCINSHTDPNQYPWLNNVNGGIDYIEFEEPAGSGNWQSYTPQTWQAHCDAVSHNPSNLVESHMSSFVNPSTRFAKLKMHFNDGTVREPTRQDYEKEAQWFGGNIGGRR